MRSKLSAGLLALGLVACGSGSTSATKVDGSVSGKSFSNPTAFFRIANGATRDKVLVLISDDPDACSHLQTIPGDVKSTVLGSRSGVGCTPSSRVPSLFLSLDEDLTVGDDKKRTVGSSMDADFDPGTVGFPCSGGTTSGSSGTSGTSGSSGSSGTSGSTGTEPTTGGSSGSSGSTGTTSSLTGTSPLVKPNSSGGNMYKSDASGSASDSAQGDFDLAFPNGDHLKGSFKAQSCTKIEGGCSSASGLALLPSLAAALLLRRRRRS